jgi:hypothetical protein
MIDENIFLFNELRLKNIILKHKLKKLNITVDKLNTIIDDSYAHIFFLIQNAINNEKNIKKIQDFNWNHNRTIDTLISNLI